MAKAVELAYTAGIVDGEGSITIERFRDPHSVQRCSYRIKLRVTNTNKWLLEYLRFQFGGGITKTKKRKDTYRDVWTWYITSLPAMECLKLILPYLRIKRPQAELALKFQMAKVGKGGKGHFKTTEELVIEEAQYILAGNLNKRGN